MKGGRDGVKYTSVAGQISNLQKKKLSLSTLQVQL